MKTLRDYNDMWLAFDNLRELWTSEKILEALAQYLGGDEMRRFTEDFIRTWDIDGYFRDYEEFAEEE